MTRRCSWCSRELGVEVRRDAVTCSTPCRQARHRFIRAVGVPTARADVPLRLAYADPPYPGMSARYYAEHPDYAGEVDHAALIRELATYDGWALSTSAASLPAVLALCPPGTRVASWHRGERPNQAAGVPQNAWEPVLFHGGRVHPERAASEALTWSTRRVDVLDYHARPRLTDRDRVVGSKPAVFCRWIFDLLGALPGDDFHDLFPGSGGVSRAWNVYVDAAATLTPKETP